MPAKSRAQQRLIGMALHNPSKVRKGNKSILKMKRSDMRDFASTKHRNLPSRVKR